MSSFKHHPDGYVVVEGHRFPLELFQQVETEYSLPSGYIGREYTPGKRHALTTSNSADPQPLEWPEGDLYISRLPMYLSMYADWLASQQDDDDIDPVASAFWSARSGFGESTQASEAISQLVSGLEGLSVEDRSYVILARIMALKDGLTIEQVTQATTRQQATSYVTSKPEWTNLPNTVKPFMADLMETQAGIIHALILLMS